jgi:hypothetical protein
MPAPAERDRRLQIVFAFMIIYAGLLFAVRPQPNALQVAFRCAMIVIGVGGFIYVERRKRHRGG